MVNGGSYDFPAHQKSASNRPGHVNAKRTMKPHPLFEIWQIYPGLVKPHP